MGNADERAGQATAWAARADQAFREAGIRQRKTEAGNDYAPLVVDRQDARRRQYDDRQDEQRGVVTSEWPRIGTPTFGLRRRQVGSAATRGAGRRGRWTR